MNIEKIKKIARKILSEELKSNQKALQVKIHGKWEYVFSRTEGKSDPVTTPNRRKAISGDQQSLKYFQNNFANHEFRIEDPKQK